jgi:hypothetical protein
MISLIPVREGLEEIYSTPYYGVELFTLNPLQSSSIPSKSNKAEGSGSRLAWPYAGLHFYKWFSNIF